MSRREAQVDITAEEYLAFKEAFEGVIEERGIKHPCFTWQPAYFYGEGEPYWAYRVRYFAVIGGRLYSSWLRLDPALIRASLLGAVTGAIDMLSDLYQLTVEAIEE